MQSAGYCLDQTLAALGATDVIRLSAGAFTQYTAGGVADQCPGAGLAAIHPEKIPLLCRYRALMVHNEGKIVMNKLLTRREALAAALAGGTLHGEAAATRQATGVKVGEITPTSAVIWTRRTRSSTRLSTGVRYRATGKEATQSGAGRRRRCD
jgi:hypothetical protein